MNNIKNLFTSFLRWFFSTRGLAILLLAGITTNLTGSRFEDIVKKQRYLESLQYEIRSNLANTIAITDQFNKNGFLYNKQFIPTQSYRSALDSGYLISIDPQLFLEITTYYDVVDDYNELLVRLYGKLEKLDDDWSICKYVQASTESANYDVCKQSELTYKFAQSHVSKEVVDTWRDTTNWIIENKIDQRFNPTQDRLKSPLLKLLMGDKALLYLK